MTSTVDEDLLRYICRFLFPFDTVLQALSDDKQPTLYRVLPFKQYLINKCEFVDNDDEAIKQVKSFLGMKCKKIMNVNPLLFFTI